MILEENVSIRTQIRACVTEVICAIKVGPNRLHSPSTLVEGYQQLLHEAGHEIDTGILFSRYSTVGCRLKFSKNTLCHYH